MTCAASRQPALRARAGVPAALGQVARPAESNVKIRVPRMLASSAPCAILLATLACRPPTPHANVGDGRVEAMPQTPMATDRKDANMQPKDAKITADEESKPATEPHRTETAYFAGGCFWGIEHSFQLGPGVIDAVSGYMQGFVDNATYHQVCAGTTGHAETVKVVFDPQRITYRRLLEAFFAMHDPTTMDRQGPDVGSQYRSGIWCANERQKSEAEAFVKELSAKGEFRGRRIVTQIEPAKTFYPAEAYHQDYIEKTGGACHVASPW